jgi:murein DD-endopeptidase MepM/ murein hydrolase activator NlpD
MILRLHHSFIRDDDYKVGGFWEGWPCEGPLTQVFAKLSVTGSIHAGDDIAVVQGTPLYAWADGEVRNENWGDFGQHVYLRHGFDDLLQRDVNGIAGHCSVINIVPTGKKVAAGELIAYSGNTGKSTGPHVHFGFGAYPISGDFRQCFPAKSFIDRAAMEDDFAMAPYERGLLAVAYGDPTVMSKSYDGLDSLGYFVAINATDGVAEPFLNEPDPVKQLNNVTVRRNRICALACDAVNGPKAWEAVN